VSVVMQSGHRTRARSRLRLKAAEDQTSFLLPICGGQGILSMLQPTGIGNGTVLRHMQSRWKSDKQRSMLNVCRCGWGRLGYSTWELR
jgi:hypothetical protein